MIALFGISCITDVKIRDGKRNKFDNFQVILKNKLSPDNFRANLILRPLYSRHYNRAKAQFAQIWNITQKLFSHAAISHSGKNDCSPFTHWNLKLALHASRPHLNIAGISIYNASRPYRFCTTSYVRVSVLGRRDKWFSKIEEFRRDW
jgi:hypothetical protein